jgi:hypothetical protein
MKYLLFCIVGMLSLLTHAQPDIKRSINFKAKYCNEYLFNGGYYMYVHSNGNVYAMYIKSNNGPPDKDCYLVKLNAQYDTVWTRKYAGSEEDHLYFIREMPNGNLLLAGHTSSNDGDVWYGHTYSAREIWMLEVDTLGNIIKGKTFGGGNGSELSDIIVSTDGYIYLAGNTIANDYDFACATCRPLDGSAWVAKYDTAFNKVWINMYAGNGDDGWPSIKEILPTRYMIGYLTNSTSPESDPGNAKGFADLLAVYIDSGGQTLWKKRYGSASSDATTGVSVVDPVTKDVYFVGETLLQQGTTSGDISYVSGNAWIHKIDTMGNVKGSKAYGAQTDQTFIRDAIWYKGNLYVFAVSDGGGGDMDPNIGPLHDGNAWIALIDTNVNLIGKYTFGAIGFDFIRNSFVTQNRLMIFNTFGVYNNPWKCDTANVTAIIFNIDDAPLGIEEAKSNRDKIFILTPNPVNGELQIQIEDKYKNEKVRFIILDMNGKQVKSGNLNKGANTTRIDIKELARGNYSVQVELNNHIETKQFIKL